MVLSSSTKHLFPPFEPGRYCGCLDQDGMVKKHAVLSPHRALNRPERFYFSPWGSQLPGKEWDYPMTSQVQRARGRDSRCSRTQVSWIKKLLGKWFLQLWLPQQTVSPREAPRPALAKARARSRAAARRRQTGETVKVRLQKKRKAKGPEAKGRGRETG